MRATEISAFIIFVACAVHTAGFSYPQLKLLSVVFRHGDRDNNDEVSGQLTNVGKLRAYNLGEILRARYGDFIGETYEPSRLYARSTEYVRARASMQLMLAPLFAPTGRQRWHQSLNWQPIPFGYNEPSDKLLLFTKSCPRFVREYEKVFSSAEYEKLLDPYREMMRNLSVATGTAVNNSNDLFLLYQRLISMEAMNEPLPDWSRDIYPDGLLFNATIFQYGVLKFTDWMRRVNGGTLVRKIVDDMVNRTDENQPGKREVYLYSTHEMMIVAVLQSLKVWQPHIPEYSSAVIFELREDRKSYYVKVLYNKGIPPIFKELQIPGCASLCPLNKFSELLADNLPDYEEMICEEKPIAFK